MIKQAIDTFARGRWALPAVLVLALAAVVVNESTYQHSRYTLARGIALTDARIQAARTLQVLTDAETNARAFLLSEQAADSAAYRQAAMALPAAEEGAFKLIAQLDPGKNVSVAIVRAQIGDRLQTLERWMNLAAIGQRGQAQQLAGSDLGRQRFAELRLEFDRVLERAAAVQEVARGSLYDAMMLNRVALHSMVLLSLVALVLFMRQLRRSDEQQAQEQLRLERQIHARTAELRELAGHLVAAREDERGRVARELHDEMGGLLTAMKLEFARLRRVPDLPVAARERMAGIEARLNDGIALKRRIVENLRPSSLDQLGLCTALEMLCVDTASNLGILVHHHLRPVQLDKDAELTVYRLVQESLNNISKYAKASEVIVNLEAVGSPSDETAQVTVRDDGVGFDIGSVPAGHHGLLGMRVRVESHAGTLTIDSAPGRGTVVLAALPVSGPPMAERHAAGLDGPHGPYGPYGPQGPDTRT